MLGLESLVLRAVPLLRATHPPVQRPVSLLASCVPSCAGLHRLGAQLSRVCAACLPPGIQASRARASHRIHPGAGAGNKPGAVVPGHRFVSHFTGRWPGLPLCGLFPSHGCASWAWADVRTPWSGSHPWWCSWVQPAFLPPSFLMRRPFHA